MRVWLSTYRLRGDAEPMVGLAPRLRAIGAEVWVCAPRDGAERPAELNVRLVPIGATAEGCVTPAATGVMPAGAGR
jgi:vancomycin aglycone glucosyltransferase